MSTAAELNRPRGRPTPRLPSLSRSAWLLLIGCIALATPTMITVARFSWSTEQGGHGPLVLATGLWLLWREVPRVWPLRRPGSALVVALLLPICLLFYLLAHITGIIEIEGFALYGALIVAAYALLGGTVLRELWFPILYLGFVFPPPDQVVAVITQPLKIAISEQAVNLLYALGYPIGSSGVSIQIAQYDLLVAAACAGLNSIISLTAICLFYIYVRHQANWRYAALLMLTIVPIAIFANFIRVILLILITYYFGDAAAQGFAHDFAGLVMFLVSVLTIFAIDAVATPLRRALGNGHD
ncbi:exosortase V [Sphingomonas yunnanensis]|uniref:exosortase V n=1 Tax=Sphingomonas yunnanensis TaxID=310400 RepID=UPI001CA72CCF|nr:exosortase V [Sphingomonas yunnanensis]MBY9064668.1 exosortase V [Sphingomonas yunnanensis]